MLQLRRRPALTRAAMAFGLTVFTAACSGAHGDRSSYGQAAPTSVAGQTHVVRAGDTVYGIARRYNVSKHAIREANGLDNRYAISVGQLLRIPNGGGGAVAAAQPVRAQPVRAQAAPAQPVRAPQPRATTVAFGKVEPMLRPVDGDVVSEFGALSDGAPNDGIDIAAPVGAAVKAAADGQVAFVSDATSPLGSVVLLQHDGGIVTIYGRIANVAVRQGQHIARGAPLAQVASPRAGGRSVLHFELRRGSDPIDPTPYL